MDKWQGIKVATWKIPTGRKGIKPLPHENEKNPVPGLCQSCAEASTLGDTRNSNG